MSPAIILAIYFVSLVISFISSFVIKLILQAMSA
jgi:hypothetical protein